MIDFTGYTFVEVRADRLRHGDQIKVSKNDVVHVECSWDFHGFVCVEPKGEWLCTLIFPWDAAVQVVV